VIIAIPNQLYSSSYVDSYLVLANTIPDLDTFTQHCGARAGYALIICQRIFADLYGNSLCLKREYELYYEPEYASLQEFLKRNYKLPKVFLKRADALAQQYNFIFLYEPRETFLEGDEGLARLQRFLGDDEQ
jgi:hypothetical protein